MDYKKMGRRIKALRQGKGISQSQLAEIVGISAGFMSLIETGDKTGSFDTYLRISVALDATLDEISRDIVPKANYSYKQNQLLHYFAELNEKEQAFVLEILRSFHSFVKN